MRIIPLKTRGTANQVTSHSGGFLINGKRYKRVLTSTVKLPDGQYENMVFSYRHQIDWSGLVCTRSDNYICPLAALARLAGRKLVVGKRQRGHGRRNRRTGAHP